MGMPRAVDEARLAEGRFEPEKFLVIIATVSMAMDEVRNILADFLYKAIGYAIQKAVLFD